MALDSQLIFGVGMVCTDWIKWRCWLNKLTSLLPLPQVVWYSSTFLLICCSCHLAFILWPKLTLVGYFNECEWIFVRLLDIGLEYFGCGEVWFCLWEGIKEYRELDAEFARKASQARKTKPCVNRVCHLISAELIGYATCVILLSTKVSIQSSVAAM